MGLFDRWRRKKPPEMKSTVKAREIMTSQGPMPRATPRPSLVKPGTEAASEVEALLAEHHRLLQRREDLQKERTELTMRLDSGELGATEFRRLLMTMIQEASQISESLRDNASKLTSLGHPVGGI
ncbi:MAG: hypothetical protein AM324_002585 [Candidatus Thorarchaeota archaeon SMTZ1-83]|nr:MAG: hypothetical protein AM324_03595 [Candidatus Thorarchaeota archaeon SMTZ1-83]